MCSARSGVPGQKGDTARANAAGFTLIELLVVVVIIAVLAGLLFQVTGRIKESANRTKCLSNLRQLGLGILTYAGQNNYVLPGPVYRGIEYPDRGNMSESHLGKFIQVHLNFGPEVWRCPSNDAAFNANGRRPVYVINSRVSTSPTLFFGQVSPEIAPKSLLQIEAAGKSGEEATVTERSRIWMISDIDGTNYNPVSSNGSGAALQPTVPPPHWGGRNYLFFDGHGEYGPLGNWPANP